MPLPAINNLRTALTAAINVLSTASESSPLLVGVVSTSGFPQRGIISIDEEVLFYDQSFGGNSTTFAVIRRGFDGSPITSHTDKEAVDLRMTALHIVEASNQRKLDLDYTVAEDANILTLPSHLRITKLELKVMEAFDTNAQVRVYGIGTAAGGSPMGSPASPAVSPVGSGVVATVLMDFDDSELDQLVTYDKSVNYGPGEYNDSYSLHLEWLNNSLTVQGAFQLLVHTVPNDL